MQRNEIVQGMKVVPSSKSVGISLEDSVVWPNEKGFLFVVGFNDDLGVIVCGEELSEIGAGDYFYASDLEAFVE